MATLDPKTEEAARKWLALADAGDANATWASAAMLFQRAVPADQWARSLAIAREPLGAVVSRAVREAKPMTELPGARDGAYVVFEFDTQVGRKRAAVEVVTPMRDPDGSWRVSGYFIR